MATILLGHWSEQYDAVSNLILPFHLLVPFSLFSLPCCATSTLLNKSYVRYPPIFSAILVNTVKVNRQKLPVRMRRISQKVTDPLITDNISKTPLQRMRKEEIKKHMQGK